MLKRIVIVSAYLLLGVSLGLAEGPTPPNTLLEALNKGEQEIAERKAEGGPEKSGAKTSAIEIPSFYKDRPKTSDEEIAYLLDEVEKLKTKVVLTKKTTLSTSTPRKGKSVGSHTRRKLSWSMD